MHDVKAIRDDPQTFASAWAARGVADAAGVVDAILEADRKLRAAQTALQSAQSQRNDASKLIGAAKAKKDEHRAAELMAEVEALKAEMGRHFEDEATFGASLRGLLAGLPNLPAADVPTGEDETGNVEIRRWGAPTAIIDPKDHVTLGEALGMMDFEGAARMSGSRFVALKGQLARLERALGQFMLDIQTLEFGYTEVSPPLLVRDEAVFGTGQLPKFKDDLFSVGHLDWDAIYAAQADGLSRRLSGLAPAVTPDAIARLNFEAATDILDRIRTGEFAERKWLIPTAEVSLTNLVREQLLAEETLPLRLTALTPCFRSEAGASGRDTRGMIRQHQFHKVELVSITTPEQSEAEHERMTACAEAVLQRLELPYRTLLLCDGDMGFSARKTYDLEVWLPSQATYREISSISNCGDFQARRMEARARKTGEKGGRYVHTLNGSGLAVGRTLVAVMENYQDQNGRIAVPAALQPYMRGLTHIGGPNLGDGA
jgi:seryl-tRNA synthetase